MTKKNKQRKYETTKKIRFVEDHSLKHRSDICPTNLQEEKKRFLQHGKTPNFLHNDTGALEELTNKSKGQIRFDLLGEAEYVLETVLQKFGEGENYLSQAYGKRITRVEASEIVSNYLEENSLGDALTLIWCDDLPCSARMVWEGPMVRCNRPEARKYSLWLNGSMENPYIREQGICCLMDHELGTHFFRMYNDGLQPWFSDRKRFGLRGMSSFECMCTEEGLAAVNTALRANLHYLWLPALVYYTACKSAEMTFKQLFDHLGRYLKNREQRWKHVMRVKRGLTDPNDLGGYGKDQCYFEGAVQILRNVDNIDFHLLMSGKLCVDEVSRIKRVARKDCLKIPVFMKNIEWYKRKLRHMAVLNGLHIEHPKRSPPLAYLHRLKQRQNRVGIAGSSNQNRRKVRKRCKKKKSPSRLSNTRKYKVKVFLPQVNSKSSQESAKSSQEDDSDLRSDTVSEENKEKCIEETFAESPDILRKADKIPSHSRKSPCDTRISSSLSDTQLVRGLPPFPFRPPLPPITTPRTDTVVESNRDNSDCPQSTGKCSSSSASVSSLNSQTNFLFPEDNFPDPLQVNINTLHLRDDYPFSSDEVTSSDDSSNDEDDEEEEEEIY